MRFNDAVFGVVLVLFAVAEIAYTQTFPSLFGQAYGPDLFPILIGVGLLICGLCLVARGIATRATVPLIVAGDWARDRYAKVNVALLLLAIVIYIVASDWLGFVPISVVVLSVLLFRFGSALWLSIAVAIAVTFLIYFLFARVLLVPLPPGLLHSVFW